jgi:hypothetical protein
MTPKDDAKLAVNIGIVVLISVLVASSMSHLKNEKY